MTLPVGMLLFGVLLFVMCGITRLSMAELFPPRVAVQGLQHVILVFLAVSDLITALRPSPGH